MFLFNVVFNVCINVFHVPGARRASRPPGPAPQPARGGGGGQLGWRIGGAVANHSLIHVFWGTLRTKQIREAQKLC